MLLLLSMNDLLKVRELFSVGTAVFQTIWIYLSLSVPSMILHLTWVDHQILSVDCTKGSVRISIVKACGFQSAFGSVSFMAQMGSSGLCLLTHIHS